MTVQPGTQVVLTGSQESLASAQVTYTVSNGHEAKSNSFTVTTDRTWVQLDGTAGGEVGPLDEVDFTVELDQSQISLLPDGEYSAQLRIADTEEGGPDLDLEILVVIETPETGSGEEGRITDGLLALYDFEEGSGTIVRDTSEVSPALDLVIETPGSVLWQPGQLVLSGDSRIASPGAASKLNDACSASGEFTVEAWIRPEVVEQSGPARIFSISNGSTDRNVTLGHGGSGIESDTAYNIRTRTTTTNANGVPAVITPAGSIQEGLQHVVFVRAPGGQASVYLDGTLVQTATVSGDLSSWDDSYRLVLGNELGTGRPWFGSLHLMAMYDRALTQDEVLQNFDQGTGDQGGGYMVVSPQSDFVVYGATGTELGGEYKDYSISNPGTQAISWSVESDDPWVLVDGSASGTLQPGAEEVVRIRLDGPSVALLNSGVYTSTLDWSCTPGGFGNLSVDVLLSLSDGDSGEKPGPWNTGPSDPGLLVPTGSITADVDGMVIENVDVSGSITVEANNVTIRNFRIDGQGALYGINASWNEGILIEDGEIFNISSAGLMGKNFTARRLNIHHSGKDGIKAHSNTLVENSWIHKLGMTPGAHADGDQTRSGTNIVFRGNNIDMPYGEPGHLSNAAFMIQDEVGPVSDFLIEGNWLNGGNFTIMLADEDFGGPSNIRIFNNRFGRDSQYGTFYGDGLPYQASGNVWDDNDELLPWNNQ